MPDYDRTGPSGEGPLTGRKRGRCGGSLSEQNKKEDDSGSGRRFGFRRSRGNNGRGRRRGEQGSGRRPGE